MTVFLLDSIAPICHYFTFVIRQIHKRNRPHLIQPAIVLSIRKEVLELLASEHTHSEGLCNVAW